MAAFGACGSTVFTGSTPAELVGAKSWEFTESVKTSEYADNSTGCGTADTVGPVTQQGKIVYNLQSGSDKGKLPLRAGQYEDVQLHIDDTGSNYWEGSILITEVGGHVYDNESSDPVSVEFSFKVQGELVGVGTLAEA